MQMAATTPLIASIPPAEGRTCATCLRDIPAGVPVFADRSGTIYCSRCALAAGTVVEGFDCPTCRDHCGHREGGGPGCGHFLCQAYAVGGIIPDDPDPAYTSCPGAPRQVVRVQEFARALKFGYAPVLSPKVRSFLWGGTRS